MLKLEHLKRSFIPFLSKKVELKKTKSDSMVTKSNSKVQYNFRVEPHIKEIFNKKCSDEGRNPSLVLRNMMKSFLDLCVFISLFSCFPFLSVDLYSFFL